MRAAVIEAPGVLKIWDIPQPVPGEYDALCENLYGATCTGTDTHLIRNTFPWGCTYPAILGHESIGRVIECGSKVRNLRVGDLVTRVSAPADPTIGLSVSWGGFAQYGIARDHWAMRADGLKRSLWNSYRPNQVIPPNFDPAAATMIITWRETLSYVSRMRIHKGSRVLVLGTGANGLSIANQAANAEAQAVLVVGSTARKEAAMRVGATDFRDYKSTAPDKHGAWTRVSRPTAASAPDSLKADYPDGFDFIIDAVGKRDNLNTYLPMLRAGGTVGVYGIDDYNIYSMNPLLPGGSFTFFNGGYDEEESHARVVDLIRTGGLRADDYLTQGNIVPLDDIEQAYAVSLGLQAHQDSCRSDMNPSRPTFDTGWVNALPRVRGSHLPSRDFSELRIGAAGEQAHAHVFRLVVVLFEHGLAIIDEDFHNTPVNEYPQRYVLTRL